MPGYAKQRSNWQDFPVTSTPILASNLNALETAIFDLKYLTYNVKDYGAVGDGVADDTSAIDAAITAAANGGVVYFPPGTYKTTGGHTPTHGARIVGADQTSTKLLHTGSSYCIRLKNETSGEESSGLEHLTILGSDGSHAAVAGAIGVEVSNGLRAKFTHVWIYGYTAAGSVGVNFHNTSGLGWTENTTAVALAVINCTTLIRFTSDTGTVGSFGYTRFYGLMLQVYASQVAINVGGAGPVTSVLYNSLVEGSLHYTGNSGVAVQVTSTGSVWQGSKFLIDGEVLSGTGLTRISVAASGVFTARGHIYTSNTPAPDSISGGFGFVEDNRTYAETVNWDLASTGTLTIPGGSELWNVTGTANITVINGSWDGRVVTLKFAGTASGTGVTDGNNLKLAGNFVYTPDDTISLGCLSGVWYEVARSVN